MVVNRARTKGRKGLSQGAEDPEPHYLKKDLCLGWSTGFLASDLKILTWNADRRQ
jgi:hypothetical protein